MFGGRGIGVDNSAAKIAALRAAGQQGVLADASKLDLRAGSFRYATLMNFLEHLPDAKVGAAVIAQAIRVSRDFVYILGPNFDDLEYLEQLGFKKFYAHWKGHRWHHTRAELQAILDELKVRYRIVETERIKDSGHSYIHPLSAAGDRNHYDAAIDPPKPLVKFRRPVFGWIHAVIAIAPEIDCLDVLAPALGFRMADATPMAPSASQG